MEQRQYSEIAESRDDILKEVEFLRRRNSELEKFESKYFHTDIKLNRIRNLLKILLGSTKGMIVFKDNSLTYKMVNEAFCNFVGLSENEIIGKTDYDLFPKNEAEINREGDLQVVKTKKPLIQNKLITGGEKREFLKIVKNPIYSDKDEFEGILVTGFDTTDVYEESDKSLESQTNLLFKKSNCVASLHTVTGDVLESQAVGENVEEIDKQSALIELVKNHKTEDGFNSTLLKETKGAGEVYTEKIIPFYKDKFVPVEIFTKLVDYNKQPAVLSIIRDISGRNQAEKILKKKVDEQALILDTIEMQVWFLINASSFGLVNKAHSEFLGYHKDAVEYKSYFEIYDKETAEKLTRSNLEIFENKKQVRLHEWVPNHAGEKRLLNILKTPKLDINGNVESILCSAEDVTERFLAESEIQKYIEEMNETKDLMEEKAFDLVQLNLKLEESEEELRKLNASKDKFFSIIAHDLKSPFTALLGYTDILVQDFNELSQEEIKEFIASLHETSRNVFQLLEGLLNWSRIQTGRMPYEPEHFDLLEISLLVVKLFIRNAERKRISLINKVKESTVVFADREMINGIIRNLVSNAIKFTPAEGSITIEAKEIGEFYQVSVTDTGVGISEKDIDKLFKIDVHHTTKGTENEMGTGVGLILCKELIMKNGGNIWVESILGKGTSFIFTLQKSK